MGSLLLTGTQSSSLVLVDKLDPDSKPLFRSTLKNKELASDKGNWKSPVLTEELMIKEELDELSNESFNYKILLSNQTKSTVEMSSKSATSIRRKRNKLGKKIMSSTPKTKTLTEQKPINPIYCEICDKTYSTNIQFALHSIIHSKDNRYSCHFCEKTFPSKYVLEYHVTAHDGTTKYKCEVCQKGFVLHSDAKEHKYVHTGETPFQCEVCGKSFMFSRLLIAHRRTTHYEIVTGQPLVKYDCPICQKHYNSCTGLRKHRLSKHNDEGVDLSVLCDICGKKIMNANKLKLHRRIHTGQKPFSCDICKKCFTQKESLATHRRVHTGEKPFKCKFCEKGFSQRSSRVAHERLHTGERPYICLLCKKGYVTKASLDAHMRSCTKVTSS